MLEVYTLTSLDVFGSGREISSRPTGFKIELTIRPVDAGIEPQRALSAIAIIDGLGRCITMTSPGRADRRA